MNKHLQETCKQYFKSSLDSTGFNLDETINSTCGGGGTNKGKHNFLFLFLFFFWGGAQFHLYFFINYHQSCSIMNSIVQKANFIAKFIFVHKWTCVNIQISALQDKCNDFSSTSILNRSTGSNQCKYKAST